jgi:hypothetical protein
MIPLRDWNSYLTKLYESPDVVDNIQTFPIEEEVSSLKDKEFGVKGITKGRAKDIVIYQA